MDIIRIFDELYHCAEKGWLKIINDELGQNFSNPVIPVEIFLGIASRETNMRHIIGDNGRGFGLFQIDIGTVPDIADWWDKDFTKYFDKVLEIFSDKQEQILSKMGTTFTLTARNNSKYEISVPKDITEFDLIRITAHLCFYIFQ